MLGKLKLLVVVAALLGVGVLLAIPSGLTSMVAALLGCVIATTLYKIR